MEQKSIERLNQLLPKIRQKGIDAYNEAVKKTPVSVHPYIDEVYRSFEKQQEYYNQGRTTPGEIITHSGPGQSFHQYGMALDFHLIINGKDVWDDTHPSWKIVVDCFKKQGFAWGGNFKKRKDSPHLENSLGYTWEQLLKIYNSTFIENNIKYVNI